MLALISLLFLSAPVLWGFNRFKVRYVFGWFWAIFVSAVVWGGLMVLQRNGGEGTPRVFPLLTWGLENDLFLILDGISGPFALALAGLGLAVMLTSAQRLADVQANPEAVPDPVKFEDWRNQAAILSLVGVGLLGVLAGNSLTLLMAWAGADLLGLWVLLLRVRGRQVSELIVLDFSARVAGILLLGWGMIVARAEGVVLAFERVPAEVQVVLLLACGFRLGVLPLQVYFFEDLPLRRGVGLMTRLVIPAVSSLVLLVRAGATPTSAAWAGLLLGLTAVAGLYGAVYWFVAKNELEGRAFWVLGMGALALASAIRGEPLAVQAWGLALLLTGGGLFLFSARSRWLRGGVMVSGVLLTGLPGLPTAMGMRLYGGEGSAWVWGFVLVHALLLAGFARHAWQEGERGQVAVRAIRVAYALGLLILPGTLILVGGLGRGDFLSGAWWAAFVGVGLAGLIGGWASRKGEEGGPWRVGERFWAEGLRRVFSFHWLYRLFWRGYRLLGGVVAFITVLLEGEAGILWTLLLLFLLISLITTQAVTGG